MNRQQSKTSVLVAEETIYINYFSFVQFCMHKHTIDRWQLKDLNIDGDPNQLSIYSLQNEPDKSLY